MVELGNCGDEIPDAFTGDGGSNPHGSRLHIMVGEAVTRCPVATADEEVLHWANLVPSLHGPGLLDGLKPTELPPRARTYVSLAKGWLAEYRAKQRARHPDVEVSDA